MSEYYTHKLNHLLINIYDDNKNIWEELSVAQLLTFSYVKSEVTGSMTIDTRRMSGMNNPIGQVRQIKKIGISQFLLVRVHDATYLSKLSVGNRFLKYLSEEGLVFI